MRRANGWCLPLVFLSALAGLSACEDPPAKPTGAASGAPATSAPATSAALPASAPATDEDRALDGALRDEIPPDVDPARLDKLKKEGDAPGVQALYDRFSWQSFTALNWPTDDAGKPKAKIGDAGMPAWMQWKESFDVFLEDGGTPPPWGSPRKLPGNTPTAKMAPLPDGKGASRAVRLLFTSGSRPKKTTADELNQAFTFPLWDQAGDIVYYEVLLNHPEFDYLVTNALYDFDGQIAFAKKNPGKDLDPKNCNHPNSTVVVMPSGMFGTKDLGAIEIKLAWKILTPADVAERYLVADGLVPKDVTITGTCAAGTQVAAIHGNAWTTVKLGLIGFHISHKTKTGPQWVWSTFEQVDNLAVNAMEAQRSGGDKHRKLTASFNDTSCETCPVNSCVDPPLDKQGHVVPGNWHKPQLQRVVPIDLETAAENRRWERLLKAQGSALQYYELVATQFPTAPDAIPTSPREDKGGTSCAGTDANPINLPASVDNKAGGKPHPTYMTNMMLESFFQIGNQGACNEVENGNCPTPLPASAPLVFATESCMGCHSSASLAVGGSKEKGPTFGNQLTADFSWLLSQKAHWRK